MAKRRGRRSYLYTHILERRKSGVLKFKRKRMPISHTVFFNIPEDINEENEETMVPEIDHVVLETKDGFYQVLGKFLSKVRMDTNSKCYIITFRTKLSIAIRSEMINKLLRHQANLAQRKKEKENDAQDTTT